MTSAVNGWTDYPSFRRIQEIGRDAYEELLFSCVPPDDQQAAVPSDYLWLSLMAWCPAAEAARHGSGFCVRMPKYHGEGWLTAFLGLDAGVDDVLTLLTDRVLGGSLHYVPRWLANPLTEDSRFVVSPQREHFDYVLDVAQQIAAEGTRFREARRRRRNFVRLHPTAVVECVPLSTGTDAQIWSVFDSWASYRDGLDAADIADERRALARLLASPDLDRCLLARLSVGSELIGFEIGEVLPDATAVSHFMKTRASINGATDVIVDAVRRALAERGVTLCNIEQDLGLPGLRTRKLMEKPAFLLEKYLVRAAA